MESRGKARMGAFSEIKLRVQRMLARGGWAQFVVPVVLSVLVWLLFTGLLALLVGAGTVSRESLGALKTGMPESNLFSISFFHLFTNGGQDLMIQGPGWLFVLTGTVLVSLLTAVFANFFDKAASDYLAGLSDYRIRGHIAFFGFDASSPDLLRQMMDGAYADCTFLVLVPGDVPQARRQLAAVLDSGRMSRIILLSGETGSSLAAERMQVGTAREIHIFGDSVSIMACLQNTASMMPEGHRIPCYAMFEERSAYAALQTSDLCERLRRKLDFLPLYRHEMWAHKVLVSRSLAPNPAGYLPLEGTEGIGPRSTCHVHFAVAGMNPAGIALALEAAMLGHYPNVLSDPSRRTRITFIDPAAHVGMLRLGAEFQSFFSLVRTRFVNPSETGVDDCPWQVPQGTEHLGGDFMDIEAEFIQADLSHPAVRQYLASQASSGDVRLTLAICRPDSDAAIGLAASLPEQVLKGAVQILVNQPDGSEVADVISSSTIASASRYGRIKAFGMKSQACDLDLMHEILGTSRSWRTDSSGNPPTNLGSKSDAARMWSDFYNAAHIWTKLRSAGSADGSIPEGMTDALARTEHNRWNTEQLLLHFRPLTAGEQQEVLAAGSGMGEVKNSLKRERMAHLDICSWERLEQIDPDVLEYDYNFVKQI